MGEGKLEKQGYKPSGPMADLNHIIWLANREFPTPMNYPEVYWEQSWLEGNGVNNRARFSIKYFPDNHFPGCKGWYEAMFWHGNMGFSVDNWVKHDTALEAEKSVMAYRAKMIQGLIGSAEKSDYESLREGKMRLLRQAVYELRKGFNFANPAMAKDAFSELFSRLTDLEKLEDFHSGKKSS